MIEASDPDYLVCESVEKALGDRRVLRGIDLSVRHGELMCLLGPSGCGKTTTLNVVAGFLFPDRGDVRLGGRPISRVPPNRRGMGMVLQSYALFPHLSVERNITFGLEMRGMARGPRREAASRMLSLVGLEGYERQRPARLSGGQQQRVALARALVIEPAVLLLDEPFSNLDARLRVQLREEVGAIQRRLGTTTLFVTHDQEEALSISDRIAVMRGGLIEQLGEPEDLYRRPASLFVARFLGDVNELRAKVVGGDGERCIVEVPGAGRVRAGAAGSPRSAGEEVVACLRPEAIRVSPPDSPGDGAAIRGRVLRRSFLGSRVTYRVATEVGELDVTSAEAARFGEGDPVRVAWEAGDLAVLTPE